ncbi:hypothetical protein RYZ27_04945 [Hyphomonas sp. FCG-A18]|uniref:hypothetical protein n=1 Tax=Hyphomonas sp. FCG-A18 TaxID=3080019 RepID=UPI002B2F0CCB|nr:hypothetical protein RYZ27_04945 [Hyphomonas sp. FCG-A18]
MRALLLATSALAVLVSCSAPTEPEQIEIETPPESPAIETVQVETGYPEQWERITFWSGEYPSALAVTGTDVQIPAHKEPTLSANRTAATKTCALPKNAVITPWNRARSEIEYVTFVYQNTITFQEDVSLEVFPRESQADLEVNQPVPLVLKAGDTMIYKTYLGEGYFIAVYDGREYELAEGELPESTVYEQSPGDEEWFGMACGTDGEQLWMSYDEALATAGVEIYHHNQYGEAFDLPEN